MSSEDNLDSSQSRGGGAPLSHDTPITTRSGRHTNPDQDAKEDETEHTSPRPPVPAPLAPSTPVQQLIFNTEVDAEMPGNMANEDQGSAGGPTVARQQKGPQYQLPPEFVPAAACGPGQSGPQAAAGEMPPPAMFVVSWLVHYLTIPSIYVIHG